jgi:hypothetical protein
VRSRRLRTEFASGRPTYGVASLSVDSSRNRSGSDGFFRVISGRFGHSSSRRFPERGHGTIASFSTWRRDALSIRTGSESPPLRLDLRRRHVLLKERRAEVILRDTLADCVFRHATLADRKRQLAPILLHFLQMSGVSPDPLPTAKRHGGEEDRRMTKHGRSAGAPTAAGSGGRVSMPAPRFGRRMVHVFARPTGRRGSEWPCPEALPCLGISGWWTSGSISQRGRLRRRPPWLWPSRPPSTS